MWTLPQRHARVSIDRHGGIRRRDFLQTLSGAALASGVAPLAQVLGAQAETLRRQGKACILLFMQGGPSQFETFSPKPGHANGGETKAISTNVAGVELSENLPQLAQTADRLAVIRSMTTKEGSHPRAVQLMHTGYLPTPTVKHPTLGSIVAHELPNPECELPSFVRIGGARRESSSGYLGVDYSPFVMVNAENLPENTMPGTDLARYHQRLALLTRMEGGYASRGGAAQVDAHQKLYAKAARMISSSQMQAFRIDNEPDSLRDAYGRTQFGAACLMARRLVESGVTFVEIALNGWDTHQDNFAKVKDLCGQIDQPFAQLLKDLGQRGMLDSTLVIWTGEFGRTPKINPNNGRDHYPRAFNAVLAGGGVRGGQVIGATDEGGSEVADRPVTEKDFFQSICQSLQIDAGKEFMTPIGRPIKIVDGGTPIAELFA